MTFNKQQFSEDLFMIRSTEKLSRKTAAIEIAVHRSTIQGLERGDYEPQISNYVKIVKWMGLEVNHYIK